MTTKLQRRIKRPDASGNSKLIIPVTSVWVIIGSLVPKLMGTGLPWIQYVIDLFANLFLFIGFLGLLFSGWQNRQWIQMIKSKDPLRIVISPIFDAYLVNENLTNDDLNDHRYCYVPSVKLVQNGFAIVALPKLLKTLTDDETINDLNAFLAQHNVGYRIDQLTVKYGWVYYHCRPDNRKDRLHYGTK